LSKNDFNHENISFVFVYPNRNRYRDRNRVVFTAVLSKNIFLILLIRVLFLAARKVPKESRRRRDFPCANAFFGAGRNLPACGGLKSRLWLDCAAMGGVCDLRDNLVLGFSRDP
jgi:hypothetical protein